ncbi:ribonuclease domain-containing protein, partial [Fusobacterium watanabei]|uniref:ribonuclease domain-containing protein n=1 Tax=Fusobacterium watanabei TaxID=2686067 RepID=UPI003B587D20
TTDGIDLSNANVGEKVGDVFLKSEIDAAGGVKKVFGWDPDKGITLTETGHFLTGFSEALLADMLLNPNLIPEKYKYRSLAYKYGELSGHSTMSVLGILGNIVGSSMGGGGTAAAPVTGGVSLTVAGGGIAVQTYSVGVIGVSSIGSVKVGLEIKTMKSEGGSSESGEIVNEDLGEINEEQQIKDNFDNLTDKEKEVFEKYEKNGWKGQYDKEGPSKAGREYKNIGERLPKYGADGKLIEYKEFDINNVKPRDNKRFVSGSDGSVYYTDDHYMTFRRIK